MNGKRARADRARLRALEAAMDAIWARIPEVHCKGLCQKACTWIRMEEIERDRITRHHGIRLEDMDVDQVAPGMFRCRALDRDTGRCTVYQDRPTVCRVWGAHQDMPCPYGCEPDGGFMSTGEGIRVLAAMSQLSGRRSKVDLEHLDVMLADPHLVAAWRKTVEENTDTARAELVRHVERVTGRRPS